MRKENNGIRNSPLKELYIRVQLVCYNSSPKRNLKKKPGQAETRKEKHWNWQILYAKSIIIIALVQNVKGKNVKFYKIS